ncbi:aspartate/glutamate racemase family protein [Yoonia sediminilitoris]|uniref:Asp/Glu/hydantoin racemase n=1 Tax=Yoonia sediminilitoris TaxID=1286148 RepID=A0A2T6KMK8_9RHOB|nr:aspartate/glutamate racemase family protein [Yoonia sediminilitoris]PUB17455.1 Asp/Glu/hydantoin racemase [Yoonia sediminilitoris]RCW97750.1 Asp/Glu/hydantoin racemase [Yoonia sediminilitoris]
MKILLLNPNTTQAMTDNMAQIARAAVGDRAEIIPVTATRGFPYIASRAEAQIAGALVLEMIAEHADTVDAVVIAAFGDPGLAGARDLFDLPIVGMAEASVMTAAMLGDSFVVVTFSPLMKRWYDECVHSTGMGNRFKGVRSPEKAPEQLLDVQTDLRSDLIALATAAATRGHADVVILGGAPLAGLATQVAAEVPAIVVDPITSAVLQAVTLIQMTATATDAPRFTKPAPKRSVGLSPPLAIAINHGGTQGEP